MRQIRWVWVVEMLGRSLWHPVEAATDRDDVMRLLRARQRQCPDDTFRTVKYRGIEGA